MIVTDHEHVSKDAALLLLILLLFMLLLLLLLLAYQRVQRLDYNLSNKQLPEIGQNEGIGSFLLISAHFCSFPLVSAHFRSMSAHLGIDVRSLPLIHASSGLMSAYLFMIPLVIFEDTWRFSNQSWCDKTTWRIIVLSVITTTKPWLEFGCLCEQHSGPLV
jgi:ABC-type Fe3+ transport system permease subunit